MHYHFQHSLVDEKDEAVRVKHWVAEQSGDSDDGHRKTQQTTAVGDFTHWNYTPASSTPVLDTVLDDEEYLKDETDVESEFDMINRNSDHRIRYSNLYPSHIDYSSDSDGIDEQQMIIMRSEKSLPPIPPESDLEAATSELNSRMRKPSVVSLSGYHLPSSVQISTSPPSSQASPQSSLAPLSRQSSFNGHVSYVGVHGHRRSLSRPPSVPLLSPSASSTLFEEDDHQERRLKELDEANDNYASSESQDHANSRVANSALVVSSNERGKVIHALSAASAQPQLSRSTSVSSSSSRRQSVNSAHSSGGLASTGHGNRPIVRHSSAGNLLTGPIQRITYSASHSHSHSYSPSLLSIRTSIHSHSRRSVIAPSRSSSSNQLDLVNSPDSPVPDSASSVQVSPQSATALLAPPPTATFGSSTSSAGEVAGSAAVVTPRNRDAVYIDAVDSEEVQRRLAELVLATTSSVESPMSVENLDSVTNDDHSQDIEYILDDYTSSHEDASRSQQSPQPVEIEQYRRDRSSHERLPLESGSDDQPEKLPLFIGGVSDTLSLSLGLMSDPPKRKTKKKVVAVEGEKKKRKSILGGSSAKADGHVLDAGAVKAAPVQRLVSFLTRAKAGASTNSSTPTITDFLNTSSPPATPVEVDPRFEVIRGPQESGITQRLRTSSMVQPATTSFSSTLSTNPLPGAVVPAPPTTRLRSSSNATRPSPLRVEVLPYAPQTPVPSTSTSTSTPTPTASTSTASANDHGKTPSVLAGPTPPLTPSTTFSRLRSESQSSHISTLFSNTQASALPTSPSSSRSSVSLSLLYDQFSPGLVEEDAELSTEDEQRRRSISEQLDDDDRSDSDLEDDGAYYVKAFGRKYDACRLRSPKPTDGDVTETEDCNKASKKTRTKRKSGTFIKRHSKHFSRSSVSKRSVGVSRPISPPASIPASPVLPVENIRVSSSTDLIDDDPFASQILTVQSPATASPSSPLQLPPPDSTTYPYALRPSKSMTTLPILDSAIVPGSQYEHARSLMSPGDLPPSRAWDEAKSTPPSPTRARTPPSPVSPGSRTPKKNRLRMSMAGLVSRLHLGGANKTRDSTFSAQPPLTPGVDGIPDLPMSPLLPTPASTPSAVVSESPLWENRARPSNDSEDDATEPPTLPFRFPSLYSGSKSASRVSLSASSTLKSGKTCTLVVSGVSQDDEQVVEYVKAWGQRFGEITQVTMKSKSKEMHLQFKRSTAAVTDTNSRTQTVSIDGIGSVKVRWELSKSVSTHALAGGMPFTVT